MAAPTAGELTTQAYRPSNEHGGLTHHFQMQRLSIGASSRRERSAAAAPSVPLGSAEKGIRRVSAWLLSNFVRPHHYQLTSDYGGVQTSRVV